jgi:DNA-binding CsgD family transcriptional regulator
MPPANSISLFFDTHPAVLALDIDSAAETEVFWDTLKASSQLMEETVYALDFHRQCFRFVSDTGPFMCGRAPEEILQSGYGFFAKVIEKKDYQLFTNIHKELVRFFNDPHSSVNDLKYMSFNFRLRKYGDFRDSLMVKQRVTPLTVNSRVRFAICAVSLSASKTSGNLTAYYRNKGVYRYSAESGQWNEETEPVRLTLREKSVLLLSKAGVTYKDISLTQLNISGSALKSVLKCLFDKLGTISIRQAISCAEEQGLLSGVFRNGDRKQIEKPKRKAWEKMTSDKCQRIQTHLDSGASVRSAAKREKYSEKAVRNNLKAGKLKKKGF